MPSRCPSTGERCTGSSAATVTCSCSSTICDGVGETSHQRVTPACTSARSTHCHRAPYVRRLDGWTSSLSSCSGNVVMWWKRLFMLWRWISSVSSWKTRHYIPVRNTWRLSWGVLKPGRATSQTPSDGSAAACLHLQVTFASAVSRSHSGI